MQIATISRGLNKAQNNEQLLKCKIRETISNQTQEDKTYNTNC